MRLLAFDGRMGASGDMLLGALLAAGADRDVLAPVEAALNVRYRTAETTKNGIAATAVDVLVDADAGGDEGAAAESVGGDHGHDDEHDHEHHDQHHHGDADHAHHAEGTGPTRSYAEVVEIVERMDLSPDVEADARSVFELFGEAEAAVHGTNPEETHFHEVGADDAIADVVGACLLLADLDPDRVVTTPVAAGAGEVDMTHGRYPVPVPAVVEIAGRADWELWSGPEDAELLTPTGAAILAHFAEGVDTLPPLSVSAVGYGAGSKDFPRRPNVLRALVGDARGGLVRDEIAVLETTVDDISPELLGGLHETLAEAGARDVTIIPTTMKKSRPGHVIQVIVKPADAGRVARQLAAETGTLGVRQTGVSHRLIADRETETVTLEIDGEAYEVDVKVATDAAGEVFDVSAEYDDAAAVAAAVDLPVREVMQLAEEAARDEE